MQRQIQLDNNQINYTLKLSNKARKMRLAIYCDGDFVVTAPKLLSLNLIEHFIAQKAEWIIKKLNNLKSNPRILTASGSKKEYLELKAQALVLAQERIEHFNQFYNFKFNKINIKNQKTRWGSCSRKGNLNFNYKIALLPPSLADYIIVHELCHLQEFNHGPKFWTLMGKTVPDYHQRRKELKRL